MSLSAGSASAGSRRAARGPRTLASCTQPIRVKGGPCEAVRRRIPVFWVPRRGGISARGRCSRLCRIGRVSVVVLAGLGRLGRDADQDRARRGRILQLASVTHQRRDLPLALLEGDADAAVLLRTLGCELV